MCFKGVKRTIGKSQGNFILGGFTENICSTVPEIRWSQKVFWFNIYWKYVLLVISTKCCNRIIQGVPKMSTTYCETFLSSCPQILLEYPLMGRISFVSSKLVKAIKSYTIFVEVGPTVINRYTWPFCMNISVPSKSQQIPVYREFHLTGVFEKPQPDGKAAW